MDGNWSKTAVVILCWNGKKFLEEFLPSVVQYQQADSDIVVADNASEDDSLIYLKKAFPSVKIIELEKNFGFAEGYNQAIRKIDSEFIVLLNQDVAVTENWLSPMVMMMEKDASIGAVQPRIRSHLQPAKFEYAGAAGGWIDKYGYTFCRGRIFDAVEADNDQYNEPAEIFWTSGACMIVRKKVYEQLGGLDASFFAHMEEIDFCWRLKNAGFKNMYCPHSIVYHLGGGSLAHGNPLKTYLNFRNNLIMMSKNLPQKNRAGILLVRILLDNIAALRALTGFRFSDFIAIWKAYFHYLRHSRTFTPKPSFTTKSLSHMTGVYNGSVVYRYFMKRKRVFKEIVSNNKS
ncbi:MAG: glycosyltransferase family 2 protein [Chitinophagales bacterium]|nr:glycosyltransferase family 2 protein [Chitinophagales bacterium]